MSPGWFTTVTLVLAFAGGLLLAVGRTMYLRTPKTDVRVVRAWFYWTVAGASALLFFGSVGILLALGLMSPYGLEFDVIYIGGAACAGSFVPLVATRLRYHWPFWRPAGT